MRLPSVLVAVFALAAVPVLAQTGADSRQPLPAVPPPPPAMEPLDAALEPEVTIRKRDGETVEEHRVRGKLYMIKVTPDHGVPYYLIDRSGDGVFSRMEDAPGTPTLSVPMWVIGTF